MIELLVIAGIAIVGLLFAATLARWTLAQAQASTVTRILAAVERASDNFMISVARRVALITAGAIAGLSLLELLTAKHDAALAGVVAVGFGVALGAALCMLSGYLASQLGIRIASRTVHAKAVSLPHMANVLVRGGAVIAVSCASFAVLAMGGLFACLQLLWGRAPHAVFGSEPITGSMVGIALGAALAAITIQLAGSVFHSSCDANERLQPKEVQQSPQNPLLVSNIVSQQVGPCAGLSSEAFTLTTLGIVGAMSLLGNVAQHNPSFNELPIHLMSLPLLAMAVGVIATAFAVLSARCDESEPASTALWRGQMSVLAIAVAGLGSASYWLFAESGWQYAFLTTTIGAIAGTVVAQAARLRVATRLLRQLDTTRDDAFDAGKSLGVGLGAPWLVVLILGVPLAVSWHVGSGSDMTRGGFFALALCLCGLLATAPYMLTAALLEPLTTTAHQVFELAPSEKREARRRRDQCGEVGSSGMAVGRGYLIAIGEVAALFSALSLLSWGSPSGALAISIGEPSLLWGSLLGASALAAYCGVALLRATRVGEQIWQLVAHHEAGRSPPRFKEPLDMAASGALSRVALPVAIAMLTPLVPATIALYVKGEATPAQRLAQVLACVLVLQAALSLLSGLATEGTRFGALRLHRAASPSPTDEVSTVGIPINGGTLEQMIAKCAAPAGRAFTKLSAALCLFIANHHL